MSRFPPDLLDDIRQRLPVSQVVGRRVKLKRQGREWVGLSPFATEKTPSFFVNDQKGFYHDFSSGRHGDVFTFLMETEGLTFPEAVERLAQETGVRLPPRGREAEARAPQRAGLMEALEAAARAFEANLAGAEGEKARAYAARRGLKPETLAAFRFGYARAGRSFLKDQLMRAGFAVEALVEAGLLIAPEEGGAPYDRFRDRLMIPIEDGRGRVVGFGGRALEPEVKPKYLNSPETPVFRKSELLFNAHRAREPAHREQRLVLVEGYLDAVSLWQAGFKPVVAALGTAFNEGHLANLWRLAPEPVLCFDGDRAGLAAADRAVDRILPQVQDGRSVAMAHLPGGLDPDAFVAAHGVPAFEAVLAQAAPLSEALWRRERDRTPLDTPERLAGFERRLKAAVAAIQDGAVRRRYELHYRVRLSGFFWELERGRSRGGSDRARLGASAAAGARARGSARAGAGEVPVPTSPQATMTDKTLLGLLVQYPDLFETHIEAIMTGCDLAGDLDLFKQELYRILVDFEATDAAVFYKAIPPHFFTMLDDVHGHEDAERGLAAGHRLMRRFPVLRHRPPTAFVARALLLFVRLLQLRRSEAELAEANQDLAQDLRPETEARALALHRDVLALRTAARAEEAALDEWAGSLRAGRASAA